VGKPVLLEFVSSNIEIKKQISALFYFFTINPVNFPNIILCAIINTVIKYSININY